ncbi:MAG: ChaN family lipoprotein [Armatimonadetes bacterium]|nr:ChaN family lipoprotein [Armatimonadota bacterium]
MLVTLLAVALQADPYMLEIGAAGQVRVGSGLTDTQTGRPAGLADVVAAAEGKRFVLVGESHDQPAHHETQAQIIRALVAAGRDVAVGFEMFTRDNQSSLAPWTRGMWSRDEFIEKADWENQWGFDFSLYEPIFDAVRENGLPMLALNVPRDWVRQVGREGPSSLTPEQREWVPDLYLQNERHRAVFSSMMEGHPMTGSQAENTYAAMVVWDEGMADSALAYMDTRLSRKAVMVIVVGSGHMMYGQGINYRIGRRTGEECVNVICITAEGERSVSRGLADFVFVSRPADGASG